MTNPTLTQELVAIAQEVQRLPHGAKTAFYQAKALALGISERSLHIKLKQVKLSSRKRRRDAGTTTVSVEDAYMIAATAIDSQRKGNKQLLPLESNLEILKVNGEVLAGAVDEETGEYKAFSASTIHRALKLYKMHPKQLLKLTPSVQLASKHPNHVWQIDASISAQFYLNDEGTQAMDKAVYYEGKQKNLEKIKKQRLWRYVITDHTSGSIYLEYVLGAESSENLCNCLINAMQKRGENPFHGVPFMMMTDPGAAMTSAAFRNLCDNLSIDLIINKVGNARAKGQVEQAHNLVERYFEGALKLRPVHSLKELNQLADQWAWKFNATKIHGRHKKTRLGVWLTIKPEQLRLAPDVQTCQALAVNAPVERTVSNYLTIHFKGKDYYVGSVPEIEVGDILNVTVNPFSNGESVQVILFNEEGRKYFHSAPLDAKNEHGFSERAVVIGERYKQMAETTTEQNRKVLEQLITGTSSEEEARAARKAKKVPFDGRIDPFKPMKDIVLPTYLPKKGTELETKVALPTVEEKKLSPTQLAKQLKELLPSWSSEHMKWLRANYPDGAPESAISSIVETITQKVTKRPQLSVVGG